ncbi:hypothetical protein Tco_0676863 [Tanacetum coccineum]
MDCYKEDTKGIIKSSSRKLQCYLAQNLWILSLTGFNACFVVGKFLVVDYFSRGFNVKFLKKLTFKTGIRLFWDMGIVEYMRDKEVLSENWKEIVIDGKNVEFKKQRQQKCGTKETHKSSKIGDASEKECVLLPVSTARPNVYTVRAGVLIAVKTSDMLGVEDLSNPMVHH